MSNLAFCGMLFCRYLCAYLVFAPQSQSMDKIRIDKWLWAARFYKTRSLATDEINKGRIEVNQQTAKPSREVKTGDTVAIRREGLVRTVTVMGLSDVRGSAPIAQTLYADTPESIQAKDAYVQQRRFAKEPALSIEHGRPTKRDRRELQQAQHGWDDRWSASID
jgi:ribosome-associated heat shock protein Hsp15